MNLKQCVLYLILVSSAINNAASQHPDVLTNAKDTGFRGLWYYNEKLDNEYVFKYSGGLGTYPANHYPFSIYAPEVDKTFFCYGGTDQVAHDNDAKEGMKREKGDFLQESRAVFPENKTLALRRYLCYNGVYGALPSYLAGPAENGRRL